MGAAAGITLRIVFYGLIAFLPDHPNSQSVDVLLLSSPPPKPAPNCMLHEHIPFVSFRPYGNDSGECRAPGCSYIPGPGYCWCKLAKGDSVEINPLPMPPQNCVIPSTPKFKLPKNNDEQRLVDWIPRMSNINSSGELRSKFSDYLVANLPLPGWPLYSSDLAFYEDGKIFPVRFWPASQVQAVAESANMKIQLSSYQAAHLEVVVVEVDNKKYEMKVACEDAGDESCRIILGNIPPRAEDGCRPMDDDRAGEVGRDFDCYYNLVRVPPSSAIHPLPHLTKAESVEITNREYEKDVIFPCEYTKQDEPHNLPCVCVNLISSRPICPMTFFEE